MLSVRENYCPDQVTFSGAETSHPTTLVEALATNRVYDLSIAEAARKERKEASGKVVQK
jgi:hypothetical protein